MNWHAIIIPPSCALLVTLAMAWLYWMHKPSAPFPGE